MSITAAPNSTFEATVTGATAGLVGTITARIEDGQNVAVTPATTAGIVESGTGVYTATLTAPTTAGTYLVLWNQGAGAEAAEELVVPYGLGELGLVPTYTTPAAVRLELSVTADVLDDEDAIRRIVDAEDVIDRLLGGWLPDDDTTGRKIQSGDVEPWQWLKLARATAKLAARFYLQPALLASPQYTEVEGPDFAFRGPAGGAAAQLVGSQVLALLDDSGLRRIAGRATPGPKPAGHQRLGFDRFLRATRHDGT